MEKEDVVDIYNGVLLIHKEKWYLAIFKNKDESSQTFFSLLDVLSRFACLIIFYWTQDSIFIMLLLNIFIFLLKVLSLYWDAIKLIGNNLILFTSCFPSFVTWDQSIRCKSNSDLLWNQTFLSTLPKALLSYKAFHSTAVSKDNSQSPLFSVSIPLVLWEWFFLWSWGVSSHTCIAVLVRALKSLSTYLQVFTQALSSMHSALPSLLFLVSPDPQLHPLNSGPTWILLPWVTAWKPSQVKTIIEFAFILLIS